MLKLWSFGLGLVMVAGSAGAQVTVGVTNSGQCLPFGCDIGVGRYQQVYSASAFADPLTISSLSFGKNFDFGPQTESTLRPATYDLYFSVTSAAPNHLSSDPDANASSTEQLFAHFVTAGEPIGATGVTFVGDTPFSYDPSAGNLLLDIFVSGSGVQDSNKFTFFTADYGDGLTSRTISGGDYPSIALAENIGMVTAFNGTPPSGISAPEPASLALLATGLIGVLPFARRRRNRITSL